MHVIGDDISIICHVIIREAHAYARTRGHTWGRAHHTHGEWSGNETRTRFGLYLASWLARQIMATKGSENSAAKKPKRDDCIVVSYWHLAYPQRRHVWSLLLHLRSPMATKATSWATSASRHTTPGICRTSSYPKG